MGVEEHTQDQAAAEELTVETTASGTRYPIAPGYRVNVRTGPGTNYRIVRTLPYGQKIPIYCQKPGDGSPARTARRTSGTTSPTASSSPTPTSTRGVTATSHRAATDGTTRGTGAAGD
ncbi:SH3 domain-containing protein, partial [Streptomyces sp. Ncost-T6T-2b]